MMMMMTVVSVISRYPVCKQVIILGLSGGAVAGIVIVILVVLVVLALLATYAGFKYYRNGNEYR